MIAAWIEHVRRGSREEGAAGLLRRGVLRDSDRLATCCIQTLSLLRGQRLWVGGPSPPRHQLLHGIHDPILVGSNGVRHQKDPLSSAITDSNPSKEASPPTYVGEPRQPGRAFRPSSTSPGTGNEGFQTPSSMSTLSKARSSPRKDKKDAQVARSLQCCHRNGPVARRGRWDCVGCSSAWRLPGIRRVHGRRRRGPARTSGRSAGHPGLDPVQRRARGFQDATLRLVRLAH